MAPFTFALRAESACMEQIDLGRDAVVWAPVDRISTTGSEYVYVVGGIN
jgi:hypothetical protein